MMLFFVVKGIEIPVEVGSSLRDSDLTSGHKGRKTL